MNKATRILTMAGLSLAAGVTMGSAPAMASAGPVAAATATVAAAHHGPNHSAHRLVGYFRGPVSCYRAGRLGEIRNRWDDYDCTRVRGGFRRGLYALTVSWDDRGHNGGWHNGGDDHGNDPWHNGGDDHGNGGWHNGGDDHGNGPWH
jgi:hypothetical protein